jgi:hypothetical protein
MKAVTLLDLTRGGIAFSLAAIRLELAAINLDRGPIALLRIS